MNGLEWPRAGSGTLLKFCRGDNIVVQLSIVAADSLPHDSLLGRGDGREKEMDHGQQLPIQNQK